MKRLFLILSVWCAMACAGVAQSREYTYEVKWKWGLVDISAGIANIGVEQVGDVFSATLSGQSIPWEGRIYRVAESLRASVTPTAMHLHYINGTYSKPLENEANSPSPYKNILGQGTLDASPQTMEAVSVMAHMLGLYYYAGEIDFEAMNEGDAIEIPFLNESGTESTMHIQYLGTEGNCYSIKFNFNFCKYHVDCHIDKQTRVPQSFSSHIAIGHVEINLQ